MKIGHLDQKEETGDQILSKNDHTVDRSDQIPPMEIFGHLSQKKGKSTDQISVEKSGQNHPEIATSDRKKSPENSDRSGDFLENLGITDPNFKFNFKFKLELKDSILKIGSLTSHLLSINEPEIFEKATERENLSANGIANVDLPELIARQESYLLPVKELSLIHI